MFYKKVYIRAIAIIQYICSIHMSSYTTIRVSTELRDKLIALGKMNESYEDVINRYLPDEIEGGGKNAK